ncbi:MAG: hypothetical protein JO037_13305 [Actinobacteria bacterium]|nr:hypothetical protein [Actinomycetota bacterium]
MTPFIIVLGTVGSVLVLVGLVGGGFTLSGGISMPKVGNWVRLPCFAIGALLVLAAIGLGFGYGQKTAATSASSAAATSASAAAATSASAAAATPASSAAATPASPAPTTASAQPSPQFANAEAVVNQFYQDITDHNYSAAWALGGDNISNGASYSTWVAGYANTTASIALVTASDFGSDQVWAKVIATQLDGSVKTYEGTYTVQNGVIVAADIVQTS